MRLKGYKIEKPEDWDGNEATVLVEGIELWEFVNNMSESKHELFKDYSFLITRLFDARVKSFIKNVLMGTGNDKINLAHFTYRVEFQARGMPHIHGVAWICKEELEKRDISGYLCDHPKEAEKLADELLSCQLPESNPELKSIVSQVQKHHHTKSCRKYNGSCRFGFPRLPSPFTFMTKPVKNSEEDENENLLKEAKETLTSMKEFLDGDESIEDLSFEEFV